jgi:lipoyl-dependent peroxiredoxin
MKRSGSATWHGTGKEGKGMLSTGSMILKNIQYSHGSRFESAEGTNPEELIAAAHAGCFSMKLSFNLTNAGFTPSKIETECVIDFDAVKGEITGSHLNVTASVPGISLEQFDELVTDAKKNCPISKVLNTNITCQASLS